MPSGGAGTPGAGTAKDTAVVSAAVQFQKLIESLGTKADALGKPQQSRPYCGLKDQGCGQDYQKGEMHLSADTPAAATVGGINAEWNAQGSENGRLSYPTEAVEKCGLKAGGCAQSFQGGTIHWSSATGARTTGGGIQNRWKALGWENSALGYPTGEEQCGLTAGGCYQNFQGGQIHWTAKTGGHATGGGIAGEWRVVGWENGKLGYPTSEEKCGLKDSGCYQDFQGGQIHWTAKTGGHATGGGIAGRWGALGWENGKLGYPTSDEKCGLKDSGCYQDYQGGQIHWTGKTGAYETNGAIGRRWGNLGYEKGALGYPTGDEKCGLKSSGCYQSFQGGQIHWTGKTGAWMTSGAIQSFWAKQGYEQGSLGYPTGAQTCSGSNCSQTFQGGTVITTNGKASLQQSSKAAQVIAIAKSYVGAPYKYGGTTPAGWDCSGYVGYVFKKVGITLPRTSADQAKAGTTVSAANARPGDLIYHPGHIGIYAGNGMMYDAGSPSSGTSYRSYSWMGAVTFIRVL